MTLAILAVMPLAAQAQEHPGCFIIHSNGAFADLTALCPPLPVPATPAVASNSVAHSVSEAPQNERTYCEGLPDHLQDECFVNFDGSGNRFGTTFRPQSPRRSILRSASDDSDSDSGTCDNPWDLDSSGRRCGGRAASQRPGGR